MYLDWKFPSFPAAHVYNQEEQQPRHGEEARQLQREGDGDHHGPPRRQRRPVGGVAPPATATAAVVVAGPSLRRDFTLNCNDVYV